MTAPEHRSDSELRALSDRFFDSLNERDFDAARDLYARDAIYESPGLDGDRRLRGRDTIIAFFQDALAGSDFRLQVIEQFTGVDMVITLSTDGDRTFIDVLRLDDQGRIVEHLEVMPQESTRVEL